MSQEIDSEGIAVLEDIINQARIVVEEFSKQIKLRTQLLGIDKGEDVQLICQINELTKAVKDAEQHIKDCEDAINDLEQGAGEEHEN